MVMYYDEYIAMENGERPWFRVCFTGNKIQCVTYCMTKWVVVVGAHKIWPWMESVRMLTH